MPARSSRALKLLAFTAMASIGAAGGAMAAPTAMPHDIPQSLVYEHEQTLAELGRLSHRPGAVGVEARKAATLFKRHIAREREYILPPLALLPDIADGKVTADMGWALAMTDRVRADREIIFLEHTEVTERMNALHLAGLRAHDREATEFAKSAAADSLNDLEILEPTVIMIGDYLRAKLPVRP